MQYFYFDEYIHFFIIVIIFIFCKLLSSAADIVVGASLMPSHQSYVCPSIVHHFFFKSNGLLMFLCDSSDILHMCAQHYLLKNVGLRFSFSCFLFFIQVLMVKNKWKLDFGRFRPFSQSVLLHDHEACFTSILDILLTVYKWCPLGGIFLDLFDTQK